MTVKLQTLKDIRNYLLSELSDLYSEQESASISDIIISKVFNIGRSAYLLNRDEITANIKKMELVNRYCRELKTGKPVQYVTGETLFYNCIIRVNKGVLIPRPETEELADLIVKENRGFEGRITDIGTGSGCIAIALAANFPLAKVTGIDISSAAIKTAVKNALLNKVMVSFIKADLFNVAPPEIHNTDILVSNPPYVLDSEKQFMKKNVLDFEPSRALFVPDNDPLRFYRGILISANQILKPGGTLYFEINEVMGRLVHELLESHGYYVIKVMQDINGKDRIVKGRKYE